MCDQSSVQYNDGDVVWVKLGPCWWPGEVHDIKRVPPEIQPGLKKPPIAFVHFFQEDKYEYVRSLDYIYHYNCRRKHEFIKKGLDMHRAKQKHMDKFPVDVCTAETLTNGDPDIITSDEFAPQQKVSYANLFGSPANRKSTSKRNSLGSGSKPGRGRKSATPKMSTSTPTRNFHTILNTKKYEVHDLSKQDDSVVSTSNVVYECDRCDYSCTRLNVITYHHKMHIDEDNGIVSPGKGKKIKSKSKMSPQNKLSKIARCSTSTIDEDLELLKKGIDLATYDNNKKKYKSPKIKFAKTLKLTEKKKSNKKDVKGISNLLADWDDSDEEEDKTIKSVDSTLNVTGVSDMQTSQSDDNTKNLTREKSCFDFEEDEEVATIISKSPGRKIPRVIPENQKSKTPEPVALGTSNDLNTSIELNATSSKVDNVDVEITKPAIKGKRNKKSKVEFDKSVTENVISDNNDKIEKDFDQIMAETALPELPLLTTEPLELLNEIKTPDKKSRGRKKYELSKDKHSDSKVFDQDKESDSEVLKSEKKTRGKKKSEIPKSLDVSTEQILLEQGESNEACDKKSESNNKLKVVDDVPKLHDPHETRGKRKSEINVKIVENSPSEKLQSNESRSKKKSESEPKEKVMEDSHQKHESLHVTRGKRKSESIVKEKMSEDLVEQNEPRGKNKVEMVEKNLEDTSEQKESRGKHKLESITKEKISEEIIERKETRGKKKSETPLKVVESTFIEHKELPDTIDQKSKRSKFDFKEKSPEMKLDKLFSETPTKKLRGKKTMPVVEKSEENVVETIEQKHILGDESFVTDSGKKTRFNKKRESIQKDMTPEPASEATVSNISKRERPLSKRRGLSIIPKEFKDIYSTGELTEEKTEDKSNSSVNIDPELEMQTSLSDDKKSKTDENIQDLNVSKQETIKDDSSSIELQETLKENKLDLTPKRSRRHKVEIQKDKIEEIKSDTTEETVDLKLDNKRSRRVKSEILKEKIEDLKTDYNEEHIDVKMENKRSRRSQKLPETSEEKPEELKVDFSEENVDSKVDNKRSTRSHKHSEVLEEKLEDLEVDLNTGNTEVKIDNKRSRRLHKPTENLEEKTEDLSIDLNTENIEAKVDNKRPRRLLHKPSEILEEQAGDGAVDLNTENIEIKIDNKRSRRSHKQSETVEEKTEELIADLVVENVEVKVDNKRSRRLQKAPETLEEKSEELIADFNTENIEVKVDNKRSRRLKPSETLEEKTEDLSVDLNTENIEATVDNKRSRRSHKQSETLEEKTDDLPVDLNTENIEVKVDNKRSRRSHKPSETLEEKIEDLPVDLNTENIEVKVDNKRSRRSHKQSETVEEKTEDLPVDIITENIEIKVDNKRSRRSHKPSETLEEKTDDLGVDFNTENIEVKVDNKRSRRSHKPTEIMEERLEEVKTDADDPNIDIKLDSKRSRKSHKSSEIVLEKIEELNTDYNDQNIEIKLDNKRSTRSHKPTDSVEEKIEELKTDSTDENIEIKLDAKRSKKLHKPLEIVEDKTEEIKTDYTDQIIESKPDNKRSRRSQKSLETVEEQTEELNSDIMMSRRSSHKPSDISEEKIEELKKESIDGNIEVKVDNKRSRRTLKSSMSSEEKVEEMKTDSMDENNDLKLDNKRSKVAPKHKIDFEIEKVEEAKTDIIEDTIELKLDNKRSRKQKIEIKENTDELKMEEIIESSTRDVKLDNKTESVVVEDGGDSPKSKLDSPRKSRRHQQELELSTLFPKTKSENKTDFLDKFVETSTHEDVKKSDSTDKRRRQSPMKDSHRQKLETNKTELDKPIKEFGESNWNESLSESKVTNETVDEIIKSNEMPEKPRERSRILRKRGRFSYSSPTQQSSKELMGTDFSDLDKSSSFMKDESLNVSTTSYTFLESTSLTDSLLNIKKPSYSYREASAKAALENEHKLQEKLKDQKDKIEKSEKSKGKQDDSVKVMISLNDFKMEDIPLPPMPSQSPPKTIKEKQEKNVDTSPNTSQELKRTPIKFEISKMKAQINKKLITHKSFLAAEDDEENSVFSRKIQPLEKITFKSSHDKETVKECEAPKKRVMADYKKELDLEKSKEKMEQEKKMQSENLQILNDNETKSNESSVVVDDSMSTTSTSSLHCVPELDDQKVEELADKTEEAEIQSTDTNIDSENNDEKILPPLPLKHEDISAVIISGTEVKIIDPNLDTDGNKIVQQIVHEPVVTEQSTKSILETLEGNEISTIPTEISTISNDIKTEEKIVENIKELQDVLESKDTNETLFNELTKSGHLSATESKDENLSTELTLISADKIDNSTKIVSTPDYVDELESIENEIQKITSSESSPCKANIFPENIALMTTPTKENISISESIMDNKDFYAPQLTESDENTSLLLSSETKSVETIDNENSIESEIAKLTDTKPEENEIIPEQSFSTTSSKLLEILESKGDKTKVEKKLVPVTLADRKQTFVGLTAAQKRTVSLGSKFAPPKATKFVIKSSTIKDNQSHSNLAKKPKPIILSEEIIKPANNDMKNIVTTPKGVATKRNFEEDIEDKGGIKKFIIEKAVADSSTPLSGINKASRIKPTVLSQTIITSTGKIIDGGLDSNKESSVDDNMFDINSMPIVLSDDLLTPESIENMPIVISSVSEQDKTSTVQIMNKSSKVIPEKLKIISQQKPMIKPVVHQGIGKNQKVYQTGPTKLLSNKTAVITQPGKPEKFIILPSSSATAQSTGSKYTVGKRQIRTTGQPSIVVSKSLTSVSAGGSMIDAKTKAGLQTGNKVMVVTNAQGQQSRIILSPAQQKMLGSKMGTKIVTRGSPGTKGTTLSLNNIVTSKGAILTPTSTFVQTKTQTVSPQTVVTSKGQLLTSVHSQSIITSKGQILTPVTPTQMKALKGGVVQGGKKIQLHSQKIILPANTTTKPTLQSISGVKTKTVLIKGSQRQIVQKVQPNTSTPGQLRTVMQKSPALKTVSAATTVSPVMTGKQKLTIAPKTPNVIKRQIIRSQGTPTQQSHQRIILQKMPSEMKSSSTIQRPPQQKIMEQKSYIKSSRPIPSPAITSSQSVPPLVPLSPSLPKTTDTLSQSMNIEGTQTISSADTSAHSPKQLIIQDDMGNQTSITQGQILAVPGGEVVDGQPQSYMLVTVDESGNLLPLDNQALMALDPNLIGPDGNVMLQFNQGLNAATTDNTTPLTQTSTDVLTGTTEPTEISKKQSEILPDASTQDYQQLLITDDQQNLIALAAGSDQQLLMTDNQNLILTDQTVLQDPKVTLPATDQAVTYSIANAEDGQQIFISGDPEKAQHLINALASGSQDLSQIMSNTEGNLIINADGQHIILNTDSAGTEQIILATSTDGFSLPENYTPDFATQVTTNQDILAAALANTVFPQESAITEGLNIVTSATGGPLMSTTSELSPSLYQNMQLPNLPSGAVLETSLTNLAPIMSPLEVPTSGTSKKVPLDIETTSQVPKSLELPITITDPNIAQTVNSQLANELQTNLGLPITITDPNISNVRNSELTTSTFGYSLPSIDDSVQTSGTQSGGPISMPLLTEDLESETSQLNKSATTHKINKENEIETQPEELANIFEPSTTTSTSEENQSEEIENSGNGLDVLASVTTASGMINVTENNSELEHIFAEKKDDQQLPADVFARNTYISDNDIDENKESNNDCENSNVMHHDSFSQSRLTDHFVLGSPHSEIDANSDEISIQPSIVTEEGNSNHSLSDRNSLKRSFDDLDDCDENKKSKFDIS